MVKISNLVLGRVKPVCVFGKSKQILTLFRMDFFGVASDGGGEVEEKDPSHLLPKFCHKNPTMKNLGTVIP